MENPASTLEEQVKSWDPGPVTDEDSLLPEQTAAVSAMLDLPEPAAQPGDPLPPLWHWFYFLQWPGQTELGTDGHPANGHFLPPIPDRQRMFAGGRCQFVEPLRVGERAERTSSLLKAQVKHGRSGELLFVTQRNEIRQQGRTRVIEEQDIVYRSGRSSARHPEVLDLTSAPWPDAEWRLPVQPDPRLLFRFSALTANAHRIHYDQPYAREEEGYPGLVVHGPLLAVLMLELVRREEPRRVSSLAFRFRSPVFALEQVVAYGTRSEAAATLGTATHRDDRHATAEVTFA